jgi:hypothetical protein
MKRSPDPWRPATKAVQASTPVTKGAIPGKKVTVPDAQRRNYKIKPVGPLTGAIGPTTTSTVAGAKRTGVDAWYPSANARKTK